MRVPRWVRLLAAVTLAASCLAGTGVPGAAQPGSAAPVTPSGGDVSAAAAPITNPVLWEDLADIDIFRVDNTFYYSASTMHYSPGAPILRSFDLVNWEFAGHSVPRLDFGAKYDLNGGRGYVRGIWASFLNFRRSNNTFYWGGCVDFAQTHIYTATSVEGPWQKRSTIPNCYFDPGLLIDDNDAMYVAYGNTTINVAQLSADGLSQVRTQQVFQTPSSIGTLEGARFYKRNGAYYIFLTRPANGQYILKSTSGPFGPYTIRQLLLDLPGPIPGGGVPHQGGLVQTQNGDWYYLAFVDAYPGGRVPVLAPISWTADGWPVLQTVNGAWGTNYPAPNLPPPPRVVKPPTGTDTFTTLGPEWEWNHNPDNARWSAGGGLRLQTATVTNDLYSARNTLSHRILGPTSTATITLDYGSMRDGDRAGLALLRDSSAWIGVKRDGGGNRVVMVNGLTMDSNWNTTGLGTEQASAAVSGGRIWLRVNADIRPGTGRQGRFSYSTDGVNFTPLGPGFVMGNDWRFFMGYRYAIFNYATQALGGAVTVPQFTLTGPNPTPPSRVVSLRAHANGNYVTAENAGASALIANRTAVGLWERFDLINNANGSVSLRAHANNNYVCAENAGASALIANRTAVGLWEEFDLINNPNGSVSFRARANNNFVTAGAGPLIASRTTIGTSEQFELIG